MTKKENILIKQNKMSFWQKIKEGDIYVKLSLLIMSIGYFKRKQFARAIFYTLFQVLFIVFMIFVGVPNLLKLNNLGSIEYESLYNPITGKNETNNYDNSFLILLFSLIAIVFVVVFIVLYIKNIHTQYELQKLEEENKKIPKFKDDLKVMIDDKFHITLLSLPVLGIIVFTIIPLVFMFLIAFTNYDHNHMPPIRLFTWVGLRNFKTLFGAGVAGSNFGYSFGVIIIWTLIWSFFATFLNYFGGIFLAMFINNKTIKWKKVWRTIFVITIAIPQFVSLLVVKNLFASSGIINNIAANIGLLKMLQNMGLVNPSLNYIPFLTDPTWTRVMLILINCWVGFPYVMLIATGVLMNIPKDLYESATIDGANKFQLFRKITMPYMIFVTAPYLITSFIHNMNNFNVIYLLTYDRPTANMKLAGADARDVDLLVTWLFRLTSEQANYKMASTIGVVLFVISAGVTLFAFNKTIKDGREETFQ